MAKKYIDADLLRKEIERLKKHRRLREEYDYGWKNALNAISKFLDSIPEQDLPKWKIADKPILGAMYIVRKVYGALVEHAVSGCVHKGDEYIIVEELDKLPKED